MGEPPHWVTLVLITLATYRLTRFITRDAFPLVAVPRNWLQRKWDPFDDAGWENLPLYTGEARAFLFSELAKKGIPRPSQLKRSIAYLVTCAWCVSIWVGAVVVVLTAVLPLHDPLIHWRWVPLVWLTVSAGTGLISQRERDQ